MVMPACWLVVDGSIVAVSWNTEAWEDRGSEWRCKRRSCHVAVLGKHKVSKSPNALSKSDQASEDSEDAAGWFPKQLHETLLIHYDQYYAARSM